MRSARRPFGSVSFLVSSIAGLALAAGASGCGGGKPGAAAAGDAPAPAFTSGAANFVDVTAKAGISFTHRNGGIGKFWIPEMVGGGGGLFDYDGDGNLDVYLVQSGPLRAPQERGGNRLYKGDGKGGFVDVTAKAGAGGYGYGIGCAVGDADNDGDLDLYVTCLGPNILYANNGDGTFADVSRPSHADFDGFSTSAAFVDYDADGLLDLFVCEYIGWRDDSRFTDKKCTTNRGQNEYCGPNAYGAPSPSRLLHNEGGLVFTDVSQVSGIASSRGNALGVVASDLNNDGKIDIYVANDQMASFAWINKGGGKFVEEALSRACALDEVGNSQAGMGVAAADMDDDGRMDLWKVHLRRECHVLYMNKGEYFEDRTNKTGLASITRTKTGFGTGIFDADLDGLLDIFVACGKVLIVVDGTEVAGDPYAEINQFIRQTAPMKFVDATYDAGPAMEPVERHRGAAFGDFDNDGLVDILLINGNGPAHLIRNESARRGSFFGARIKDSHGRDAYHARVRVFTGDKVRTYEVRSDYSYCAANDSRIHVGLGAAKKVDKVEVRWVGGPVETFGPFDVDKYVVIEQGKGLR